jgi:hypothetical protein
VTLLFLKHFIFSWYWKLRKFLHFKEIRKCVTLSLPESKIKTVVELQNVLVNFSVEIQGNLKLYEEHT